MTSKRILIVGVLVACLTTFAGPLQAGIEPTNWPTMFFGIDVGMSAGLNTGKAGTSRQKVGALIGLRAGYMLYRPLGLSLTGVSDFTFRKTAGDKTFFAWEGMLGIEFMLRWWKVPVYLSPEITLGVYVGKEKNVSTQAGLVGKGGFAVSYLLSERFEFRFTPIRFGLVIPLTSVLKKAYSAIAYYEVLFSFRYRF